MPYSTSRRMFLLSTPLGEDVLLIQDFSCSERLSRLFHIHLTVVSERDDIAADEIVGKRVTLRIETALDERHWTGVVSAFERIGTHHDPAAGEAQLTRYTCEVVPWLWALQLHEDSRIFQEQSIPEIVETLLGEFQFHDYELQLNDDYPPLVYVTQYRETTFAFISRLLERAGIYYYVKYAAEAEKLIFTDNKDGHPTLDEDQVRFGEHRLTEEEDTVNLLSRRQHMRTGAVAMRDYNFEHPTDLLEVGVNSLVQIGDNSNYSRFVFPGGYGERGEGERLARLQMESEEADHEILDGESNVRGLVPGYRFTLDEHPDDEFNQEYVITSVQHQGHNNLGGEESAGSGYTNSFSVIPQRVLYREPSRTPKPQIPGLQSALVVGPSGEEIYTDKYGRVKLHFFWDRLSGRNDKSSCWARVMQPSASKQWGAFMLPRIGDEVMVMFEHGDPDRPLVIGSVYNADNMPPYPLPAEASKSVLFKSSTTKGGGGSNEIRFEDKAGSEEVWVHAQKDLQMRTENDSTEAIGRDRQLTVGRDLIEKVTGEKHLEVTQRQVIKVTQENHLDVGTAMLIATGTNLDVTAGVNFALDAGVNADVKAGVNLVLEAGVMISLKAGASSITIGPAGVTIDGPLVRVNCGGSPLSAQAPQKPDAAKAAAEAIKVDPGKLADPGQQAQAQALRNAAAQAQPYCAQCAAARQALQAMGMGL